jgi:hypothetical protein
MAKRRKPELPPDPAGHQAARLPAQWSEIDQAELERRHRQAALLVANGHGAISWDEIYGRR